MLSTQGDSRSRNTLGESIKFFRKRMEMSQMALEQEADIASGSLTRIENNIISPSRFNLAKIASALKLSNEETSYLFEINLFINDKKDKFNQPKQDKSEENTVKSKTKKSNN